MNRRWAPTILVKIDRACFTCQDHSRRSAVLFPLSGASLCRIHVQQTAAGSDGYLSLKRIHHPRIRIRKGWVFRAIQVRQRLGIHTSSLSLNSSASKWSVGLSQQMSRVRSTLDTVSKAVSGTHTELLSKMSRLRANTKTKRETGSSATPTDVALPAVSTERQPEPSSPSTNTSTPTPSPTTATSPVLAVRDTRSKTTKHIVPTVKNGSLMKPEKVSEIKSTTAKESTGLFHPSSLSSNLDETYTYLSHHINSYFSAVTKAKGNDADKQTLPSQPQQSSGLISVAEKKGAAVQPSSSKKSLGQYFFDSAPNMQAFVGNYISPYVPKFRSSESKGGAMEPARPEEVPVKQVQAATNKEQTAVEEKAKKLLLQREKIIARVSVDNRTRALVQALHRASDVRVYISRVEDLSCHLLEFPETCGVAVKEKVIPCLLRLGQASDPGLRAAVREALALVGYHQPVKGRGIRILSIDGGGLRGILALQTLQKLEAMSGKPIYKLFDYICGVSTGAVIGFMLGMLQIHAKECDDLYRRFGSDVFKQNVFVGTVKMGWSHAFYDSEAWENILKEKVGSQLLVETSRNPECPKVAAVSTIVNRGLPLKAYVFRNYNLLPGVRSHYLGGCRHQLWQAIRATSAAPGYFQEFKLGNDLHQDGGLLINNPTALAIHECKCLWPNTPLECVVSLGTGRFETVGKNSATYTSLKTKLTHIISSATDTEEVHAMLDAFLPPDTYFRFNPFVSEDVSMDESRQEKLDSLQAEGALYLQRNEEKLKKVARILTREKSSAQRMSEWLKLRSDMYSSWSSKL